MGNDVGTEWIMEKTVLERCVSARGNRHPHVQGRFSPRHQITLKQVYREAAKIPDEARTFVWSYPCDGWSWLVEKDTVAGSFLGCGGFVYLDKEYNIVATTTLMSPVGRQAGLFFSKPRQWNAEWTKALAKESRFQKVTIQGIQRGGARYFCWLKPGEFFLSSKKQPLVPHGGFAYLFHENLEDGTDPRDCYFAVLLEDTLIEKNSFLPGPYMMCGMPEETPFSLRDQMSPPADDADTTSVTL